MQSPEALIEAQLAAYNRQDMSAFLATFHPEVEFIRWPSTVELRGHDAFKQAYGALWARSPGLTARILNRIVMGRFVLDVEEMLNHADGPKAPVLVIYETEGGLIRRFWLVDEGT